MALTVVRFLFPARTTAVRAGSVVQKVSSRTELFWVRTGPVSNSVSQRQANTVSFLAGSFTRRCHRTAACLPLLAKSSKQNVGY